MVFIANQLTGFYLGRTFAINVINFNLSHKVDQQVQYSGLAFTPNGS